MTASRRLTWFLFTVAALLYVIGVGWGLPEGVPGRSQPWGTDELGPVGAVNEVYGLLFANKPMFNPQYPMLHYFCQLAAVAPYYAALWLSGHISYPSPVFPFGLDNPSSQLKVMTVLVRFVSVFMAAGTVVIALRTGEALGERRTGLLAAVLVMLQYPMFYYARTSNVDMGALFWTALGLLLFARVLLNGLNTRLALALGACAALSLAAKDAGYGVFLPVGVIVLVQHVQTVRQRGGAWIEALRAPSYALLASVAVYAVFSGLIFRPSRYARHLQFITMHDSDYGLFYHRYPATMAGYFDFGRELVQNLVDAMGLPMLVVSLAGIAFWTSRHRRLLPWLIPALGIVFGVLVPVRFVQLRYVMPIAYLLALPAAHVLARGLASPGLVRAATATALAGVVVWSGVRGADLTYQMLNDSRYFATEWLSTVVRTGDRIGHFVPPSNLPYLPDGVRAFSMRNGRVPDAADGDRPEFIVSIPLVDIERVHERLIPEETFQRLMDGTLGYRQVALIQGATLFERRPASYLNPPLRIFVREDIWQQRQVDDAHR